MSLARYAGAVLAAAACVASAPAPAGAAVPDSARLAGLREAITAAPIFRVVGAFGRERIADPILDSSGVRSAGWEPVASRRTAVFTAERSAPRAARAPIPWSDISALETGRPKTLQGAVGGTVVGLVVGAGIALAMNPRGAPADEEDALRSIGIVSGTTFAGTILGTWIGHRSGFRPIYRADSGLDAIRSAYAAPRPPRRMARLAAGVGAKLAWDLADPPRHHARLPEPVGGFTAGAAFSSGAMITARRESSETAIDALFDRWNMLYPPYALEGTNDH
jgi:hypothetical protein